METVEESEREGEEKGEKEKVKVGKVREESGEDGSLEDVVEEEAGLRRKVDSELISNNVALVHLLKGNIGIGVMAMPR